MCVGGGFNIPVWFSLALTVLVVETQLWNKSAKLLFTKNCVTVRLLIETKVIRKQSHNPLGFIIPIVKVKQPFAWKINKIPADRSLSLLLYVKHGLAL